MKRFALELQHRVSGGRAFCCIIAEDWDLRRLNRKFRGTNTATDVLSFPSGMRAGFLGDIAISIQRAAAQAAERRHAVDAEVRILMLHGVLHLIGLDHERDGGQMARAETKWRKAMGLPAGLIERVRT